MDRAILHRVNNLLQVVTSEHHLAMKADTLSAKDHHIGRGERAAQEIVQLVRQAEQQAESAA